MLYQHASIVSLVNFFNLLKFLLLTCCWTAPRYAQPGQLSIFCRLGRYLVLANVQGYTYSRISPNVHDATKILSTVTVINQLEFNSAFTLSHVLRNARVVTKSTSPNISDQVTFSSCSTFSLSCTASEILSCSSPQVPSRFVGLMSDLFTWYIKNVRLCLIRHKPAILILSHLCYSIYCMLEAALHLEESFSDVLWVSLALHRNLYLKHDFACKMYILSCSMTHVKACNVYVFCKLFAHLFGPQKKLCLLSGYARFCLFQRRPLLTEKYKWLVQPLHPVDTGATCAGIQHPLCLGGGTARHHSFNSIEPYVIFDGCIGHHSKMQF